MQNLQYWVRLARTIAVPLGLVLGLLLALAPSARAHDVPDEVRVLAFLKPEGQALKLVMRVPLKAMRDVDVPQRRGGFLDFTRVDTALRDAAALWLGDEIELYEDDARLPRPRVLAARVSLESDRSFASYETAVAQIERPRLAGRGDEPHHHVHLDAQALETRADGELRALGADRVLEQHVEQALAPVKLGIVPEARRVEVRHGGLIGGEGTVRFERYARRELAPPSHSAAASRNAVSTRVKSRKPPRRCGTSTSRIALRGTRMTSFSACPSGFREASTRTSSGTSCARALGARASSRPRTSPRGTAMVRAKRTQYCRFCIY